jgi:hypothetical protein
MLYKSTHERVKDRINPYKKIDVEEEIKTKPIISIPSESTFVTIATVTAIINLIFSISIMLYILFAK